MMPSSFPFGSLKLKMEKLRKRLKWMKKRKLPTRRKRQGPPHTLIYLDAESQDDLQVFTALIYLLSYALIRRSVNGPIGFLFMFNFREFILHCLLNPRLLVDATHCSQIL
jgi:hypothetical protein